MSIPLLAASAVLLLAPLASAETFKVSSGNPTDLQAAIDGAAPGDKIVVSGGPYEGNFTIPAGKDGLVIKGKATIDCHNGLGAFVVDSNGVTISGLTMRHGELSAIFGPGTATPPLAGLTVSKCTFLDCGENGIQVEADDVLVTGCVMDGCGGGANITGDRAVVTKTKVLSDGGTDSIAVMGDDAQVLKCTVTLGFGDGVFVDGARALVSGNRIASVEGDGIGVLGDDAVVTGNDVQGTQTRGIAVTGAALEVSKNDVSFSLERGIFAEGSNAVVTGNKVRSLFASGDAIEVISDSGALIESNLAQDVLDEGFELTVDGATIVKNKAIRCGIVGDSGMRVNGSGNTLDRNRAQDCDDTGIEITGSDNTLTKNKAIGNGNNGFLVAGLASVDNVFDGNTATGNDGEGLQNGGVGTVLVDNKLTKNLLDVGNETAAGATIVDEGGNKVGTGGDFVTESEIEG